MIQKLKKIWNRYFKKSFIIDFSYNDINEKKIFQNKEGFEEFLKMFKNDYIEKISNKKYLEAEVIREIIERLLGMYSEFYEEETQDKTSVVVDVVSQLQEKMKDVGKSIGQ